MHITHFEAQNFKRLKAVRIDPDTNTVVIAGRNAQGKSSVLDAIQATLAGKAGAKKLSRPIRDGESKASVVIELDDLRIERKWTPSGSTLTVGPKDGAAKLNSPQAVLDKLIGVLSFDPLAFAEAEPKKQVETLIDLIGRETFDALAAERKAAYDNRTDMNREVRSLKARLDALGPIEAGTEAVDVVELVGLRDKVRRKVDLREEWEAQQATIERALARQAEIATLAAELPDGDLVELDAKIQNAEQINAAARKAKQADDLREELASAESVAAKHTELIESVDKRRAELISEANLPVEGLTFDEDGLEFNGVPFEQASAAERLKVSTAMAMALNPDLKVICIRDASLLDNESKAALVKMAKDHDYQIWYEVVGTVVDAEVGVIIEDGEVA